MQAYLVRIGTAGNQRYIFASTKRKEVVGASHLITQVDGAWTNDALKEVFPGFSRDWRIENNDAELLMAGAGGITAIVRDHGKGRALVTALTQRALREAPGLDVCGVVRSFPWDSGAELNEAIRETRRLESAVRETRPGPEMRFARIPVVDECSASGLPASELREPSKDGRWQPRSAASVAKLNAYDGALDRLARDLRYGSRDDIAKIVTHLGEDAEWVGVVHADGNGLGTIFQKFHDHLGDVHARRYADELRAFSEDVDACAREAFREAIGKIAKPGAQGPPEVLPLVLGGDDLTVICDGEVALAFTRHYLEEFAAQAERRLRLEPPRLGAAAGVAIVKRQYPFHFAYDLAEDLVAKEAKQVKVHLGAQRCALAFHVLYESSAPELGRLRANATAPDGTELTAQPYVVGTAPDDSDGDGWAEGRRWSDLVRRVGALERRDETGERLLPRGAVHELREALFLGAGTARARRDLLARRFAGDRDRTTALQDFWQDGQQEGGLLDAMNAAGFLTTEEATR